MRKISKNFILRFKKHPKNEKNWICRNLFIILRMTQKEPSKVLIRQMAYMYINLNRYCNEGDTAPHCQLYWRHS